MTPISRYNFNTSTCVFIVLELWHDLTRYPSQREFQLQYLWLYCLETELWLRPDKRRVTKTVSHYVSAVVTPVSRYIFSTSTFDFIALELWLRLDKSRVTLTLGRYATAPGGTSITLQLQDRRLHCLGFAAGTGQETYASESRWPTIVYGIRIRLMFYILSPAPSFHLWVPDIATYAFL